MYKMVEILKMREMYYNGHFPMSYIAREFNCDWRTVKRYVEMNDFNTPLRRKGYSRGSILDPYKPAIDEMLAADKVCRCKKQIHTSRRIFEELKETTDYPGSYTTVCNYVREARERMGMTRKQFYIPLEHPAGTAQCDFGTCEYKLNGESVLGRFLVLTFPHSNARFMALCPGENQECLMESLQLIFQYLGKVPSEIWFDNGSAMVAKIRTEGKRDLTERFAQFCAHYGFKATFMNPESGNEKGAVENSVGFLRRNLLVPVPSFTSLEEGNKFLLEQCTALMSRNHYKADVPIADLFEDDLKAMIVMNPREFDTSRHIVCRTNKYGKFTVDDKYTYSASPAFCASMVNVTLTSSTVSVYDMDMTPVVQHRRLYGPKAESMDWLPYLKYIARKPRSLLNSQFLETLPDDVRQFMSGCDNSTRGRVMKMLADLTERDCFDNALHTIQEGIRANATDSDSLMVLYRKLYADVPPLPAIDTAGTEIPSVPHIPSNTDLDALDAAIQGGMTHGQGTTHQDTGRHSPMLPEAPPLQQCG